MRAPVEGNPVSAAILLVVALFAAAGLIFLLQFGLGKLQELPAFATTSPALLEGAFSVLLFASMALVAVLGFVVAGRRPLLGANPARGAGVGLLAGVLGLGIAIALSAIAGVTRGGIGAEGGIGLLLVGTLLTLFQTGVEELYFRGWLQPALQAGWGRWPGIAATALTFSALHFVTGGFDPVSAVTVALAGLFFGLLADRSGGLALPIAAHFGWNWGEELLLGVAPNPGTGNFGAVFDIDLIGSPWWGGSDEGLNASLSALFALLALVAVAIDWRELLPTKQAVLAE